MKPAVLFDDAELESMQYIYTGNGQSEINSRLVLLPANAKNVQLQSPEDEVPAIVAALDSAIKKSRMPADTTVYMSLGAGIDFASVVIGNSFRLKGFRITTTNANSVINEVGATPDTIVLKILMKKNTYGLFLSETDILLPRGIKIEVTNGPTIPDKNTGVVYFECVAKA
jgi:hypothetical protein